MPVRILPATNNIDVWGRTTAFIESTSFTYHVAEIEVRLRYDKEKIYLGFMGIDGKRILGVNIELDDLLEALQKLGKNNG